MKKNFVSNLLSKGSVGQDYLSKNIKIFNTETAKKITIFVLLFLIAIYSPKNDHKHSSEIRAVNLL